MLSNIADAVNKHKKTQADSDKTVKNRPINIKLTITKPQEFANSFPGK